MPRAIVVEVSEWPRLHLLEDPEQTRAKNRCPDIEAPALARSERTRPLDLPQSMFRYLRGKETPKWKGLRKDLRKKSVAPRSEKETTGKLRSQPPRAPERPTLQAFLAPRRGMPEPEGKASKKREEPDSPTEEEKAELRKRRAKLMESMRQDHPDAEIEERLPKRRSAGTGFGR